MPKLKNVENRIRNIESIDVVIRHPDGRDMRSDSTGIPQYNHFKRGAKNDMTVADWKAKRFAPHYPGFDIDVLDGHGVPVPGNTKIGTVRNSYSED